MSRYMGVPCKVGHSGERYIRDDSCCECRKQYQREWRKKNPDKVAILAERSYKNRDRIKKLEGLARWRENNKQKRRDYQQAWYKQNSDHVYEYSRAYAKANPYNKRISEAKRRAIKRGSGGSHTQKDIVKMYDAQGGKCVSCLKAIIKFHADHIIPLCKGGSNDIKNIQLLCQPCNQRKRDKMPEEWALQNGRLV